MEYVFVLEHVYENDEEEVKFIGIFSSIEKAQEAISYLSPQKGFKDHPSDCFKIERSKLDRYEWKEGFINRKDTM